MENSNASATCAATPIGSTYDEEKAQVIRNLEALDARKSKLERDLAAERFLEFAADLRAGRKTILEVLTAAVDEMA